MLSATYSRETLPMRRESLLMRIHVARGETATIGRHVATDMQALARSRRSFFSGLKLLRASVVAAGVIWSFNASSRMARGSRLFTVALSLLSTIRAMRKVGALLSPLTQLPERQG